MKLDSKQLEGLGALATEAALAAAEVITSYTAGNVDVQIKEGGDCLASQVVTEVDERSQAAALRILQPSLENYDLAMLAEETPDDGSRFEKDYFWCIDPMDGTLPFTRGKPGYAVSIALVRRDGTPMIGVVNDPLEKRLFHAVHGQGVRIDSSKWSLASSRTQADLLKFYVDFSFKEEEGHELVEAEMDSMAEQLGYSGKSIIVGGGPCVMPAMFSRIRDQCISRCQRMWQAAALFGTLPRLPVCLRKLVPMCATIQVPLWNSIVPSFTSSITAGFVFVPTVVWVNA